MPASEALDLLDADSIWLHRMRLLRSYAIDSSLELEWARSTDH